MNNFARSQNLEKIKGDIRARVVIPCVGIVAMPIYGYYVINLNIWEHETFDRRDHERDFQARESF